MAGCATQTLYSELGNNISLLPKYAELALSLL